MRNLIFKKINRLLFKIGSNDYKVNYLRKQGAKIGNDCLILTHEFGSEPYLIEIGNHVVVAANTTFINHDGAVWLVRDEHPKISVYGKITIGDNTFIGMNCVILYDTVIGSNCIVGAGSVVRGKIPDNSVIMGNPAKVVLNTAYAKKFFLTHKHRVDTKSMSEHEKKAALLQHFSKTK